MLAIVSPHGRRNPSMAVVEAEEPVEVVAKQTGPCDCGRRDPTSKHHAGCASRYAMIRLRDGRQLTILRENIEIVDD